HQTKKGNQWYFGMKAHIGVDEFSGLVHHVQCTAANVADITVTHALLHGKEDSVFGDSGYTGAEKRDELQSCADLPIGLQRRQMSSARRHWQCHHSLGLGIPELRLIGITDSASHQQLTVAQHCRSVIRARHQTSHCR
ncbi:hypothetical protein IXO603_19270, partial [Xanthomonas oryzae pv. oryzae]